MNYLLKLILLFAFSFLLNITIAQDKAESYVSVTLGASTPLGKFASNNFQDKSSGFATPGPSIGVDMAFFVNEILGIGGTFNFAFNFFQSKNFERAVNNNVPEMNNFYRVNDVSTYINLYSTTGFYFNLPVSEKIILIPKLLAGVLITKTPKVESNFTYPNYQGYHYNYSDRALGFAPAPVLGVNIVYDARKEMYFKVNIDYLTARQRIRRDDSRDKINFEQRINILNIMASAGFSF